MNKRTNEQTNVRTNERTNECVFISLQWNTVFAPTCILQGYIINATEGSYFVTLIHNCYGKDTVFYSIVSFLHNDDCIWNYTQCCFIDTRDHCEQILHSFFFPFFRLLLSPLPFHVCRCFKLLLFPPFLSVPFVSTSISFLLLSFLFLYVKESTKGEFTDR